MATVLITAFDRLPSMIEQLKLLEQQTCPADKFEVIIVDDSGEVGTGKKAIDSAQPKLNIHYLRTGLPREINGVSAARNLGIREAQSPLIISIDDDCLPHPYLIDEHLRAHQNPGNLIVLGSRSRIRDNLQAKPPITITERRTRKELRRSRMGRLTFFDFKTGNISVSRQDFLQAGLFNENFAQKGEHGWEDIEMGYRMLKMRMRMAFYPDAMVFQIPTEPEKEKFRNQGGAYFRARDRFLSIHPELRPIIGDSFSCNWRRFFWLKRRQNCFLKVPSGE